MATLANAGPAGLTENPHRLVSLWNMFSTSAAHLATIWPRLQELAWGFDMTGKDAVTPEEYKVTIRLLVEICDGVGWRDLGRQAKRLLARAEEGQRGEPMMRLAEDLRDAFQEKAMETQLLIIEERDTELFGEASSHLCGAGLSQSLAISEEELNLAGH